MPRRLSLDVSNRGRWITKVSVLIRETTVWTTLGTLKSCSEKTITLHCKTLLLLGPIQVVFDCGTQALAMFCDMGVSS